MTEDYKKQLQSQLWNIANTLRGKMEAIKFDAIDESSAAGQFDAASFATVPDSTVEQDETLDISGYTIPAELQAFVTAGVVSLDATMIKTAANILKFTMRGLSLAFFIMAPVIACGQGINASLPPANVFDMAVMRDASTLGLKIVSDEIQTVKGASAYKVRYIELEFLSQNWGGEDVRHIAKVYLPASGIAEDKRGLAVINQGVSSNEADGFDLEYEYGALTAIKLGIPAMLLTSNMPGDHWGVTGAGPIRRYTAAKFFETGDANWIHWIALAKVYMRAMTALNSLEGIEADKFVLAGSSKRAQAIWIVAATDDRVRGLVTIARPGNFIHLLTDRFKGVLPNPNNIRTDHTGSKHEYLAHLEDMYTTRGYEYMAYIDPYQFLSRVNVPIKYLIGTNDNLFDSFDDHGFYPFYQGDKSFAYVPNYSHGMGTKAHAMAYRAWAAHCFWDRPTTKLTALEEVKRNGITVRAIVQSKADIVAVSLRYSLLKGTRFNDAKDRYQGLTMNRIGDTNLWEATFPIDKIAGREVYWYVEARDSAQGLQSASTTLLKRSKRTRPLSNE